MDWFLQNWVWLVLIVGVVMMLSRGRHGGMMGGCCAHDMTHEIPAGKGKTPGADASNPWTKE